MELDAAKDLVTRALLPRWPDAKVAIIGGSIARGEATPTSDIDLLLVFDRVEHAWRETLKIDGRTVELFAHDAATFDYFCREIDRPAGRMPLANLVVDGVNVLAEDCAATWLRDHARRLLDLGPPPLTPAQVASRRYEITTLLEDLIDGTRPDETLATAVTLHESLAHFALRCAGAWTGTGKQLARRLRALDPALADDLAVATGTIVADPIAAKARFDAAVRRTLAPHGGLLLEGFTRHAPDGWRSEAIGFPVGAGSAPVRLDMDEP
jgi:predicted nucleotidyltransferase